MRAVFDWGTPAAISRGYTCGNCPPSSITRRSSRSSLGDLGDFGHNDRGFAVLTFVIFLAPRGKQRQMASKAARGCRTKPGSQDRRPLDSQPPARGGTSRSSSFGNAGSCESAFEGKQPAPGSSAALGQTHRVKNGANPIGEKEEGVTIPRMFKIPHNSAPTGSGITIKASDFGSTRDVAALTVEGDSTGPGRLASLDSGGLPQVKVDVGGSRSLDGHNTVSYNAGGFSQASAPFTGGNGLAAASEGEADQPLRAPGYQGNVRLAQESVTGTGYCEQAVAAYLLASTDPPTMACTLEAIRDFRQGREDSLVQGEVGENCFSLSDQSRDSDEASTSPSIDSETCDSSTAPLTPISVLRGTAIKCRPRQSEVSRSDKAGESSEKRKKKRRRVGRELCPGITQEHNSYCTVWMISWWSQPPQRPTL
ncbi:hypothetical protein NDU88_005085 [Pleurodeles waltl]|uniref:Uncharacterized protein n=1 Tax=Pleurodeles waltl TaxID=8319 RepID=A0AAV7T9T0_PLEWA|nr:hypothetical protein NDU88_005085 [Pleurodeles waltl]